jgi:hypothetical protein
MSCLSLRFIPLDEFECQIFRALLIYNDPGRPVNRQYPGFHCKGVALRQPTWNSTEPHTHLVDAS